MIGKICQILWTSKEKTSIIYKNLKDKIQDKK